MNGGLRRDARLAIRTLQRSPAFTAAVVITMALGIAATVGMFTVVNGILLRPLPFPDSERAIQLCETSPRVRDFCVASPPNVADWDAASDTLEAAGVARTESMVMRTSQGTTGVAGAIASPGFFRVLRTRPMLGRLIEDGDMDRGANDVALVSHAFWRRALQGDPNAIGRTIMMDGRPVAVTGVLPADAYFPDMGGAVELWRPLTASVDDVENRNWRGFTAIGRLATDASIDRARAELETIRARLAAAYPESNADWGIRIVGLRDRTVATTRGTLWLFLGATAFVLLIACANVAGLLLVRATTRTPEFAVRAALGAGRGQLVRQLLTESVVLSLAGGALGLLLASWITRIFVAMAPATIPRLQEVSVDARVAAFALLLSLATAMLFGVVPARRASAVNVATTLNGRRHGSPGETRLRSAFVVIEVALALVLLAGAGLLLRTFGRLLEWNPGFDREGIVTTWMLATQGPSGTSQSAVAALERARDAAVSIPGIRSAGLASGGPLFGGVEPGTLTVAGKPAADPTTATVHWFDVSPEYFDTLGIPLVKGRGLRLADAAGAPHVALINETLAKRFFPDSDPIGQRVTVMEHTSEIVGIVGDVAPARPDRPVMPEIYWPIRQYRRLAAYLVVRVGPGVQGVEQTLRSRIAAVEPNLQLSALVALDERFARGLVAPRFNLLLVGAFAAAALGLAAVGLFGITAYTVARRTREIGVRIALGARPPRIVADVVRQGLVLAALGILLGLAGVLALGRLLASLLYGLAPSDVVTLTATVLVFALVAAIASYLPARRAARIDPLTALRPD